jgi:hypothetical protein
MSQRAARTRVAMPDQQQLAELFPNRIENGDSRVLLQIIVEPDALLGWNCNIFYVNVRAKRSCKKMLQFRSLPSWAEHSSEFDLHSKRRRPRWSGLDTLFLSGQGSP